MTSTRSIAHVFCESGRPGHANAGSMAHRLQHQTSRLIEAALLLLIAAEAPCTAWLSSKGIFS
jgi:hypothetical protein